jgi:hypothetical protein
MMPASKAENTATDISCLAETLYIVRSSFCIAAQDNVSRNGAATSTRRAESINAVSLARLHQLLVEKRDGQAGTRSHREDFSPTIM